MKRIGSIIQDSSMKSVICLHLHALRGFVLLQGLVHLQL